MCADPSSHKIAPCPGFVALSHPLVISRRLCPWWRVRWSRESVLLNSGVRSCLREPVTCCLLKRSHEGHRHRSVRRGMRPCGVIRCHTFRSRSSSICELTLCQCFGADARWSSPRMYPPPTTERKIYNTNVAKLTHHSVIFRFKVNIIVCKGKIKSMQGRKEPSVYVIIVLVIVHVPRLCRRQTNIRLTTYWILQRNK